MRAETALCGARKQYADVKTDALYTQGELVSRAIYVGLQKNLGEVSQFLD